MTARTDQDSTVISDESSSNIEVSCVSEFGQLTAPRIISPKKTSTWPAKQEGAPPPLPAANSEARQESVLSEVSNTIDSNAAPAPEDLLGTYFLRKQQGEFNSPPSIPPRSLRRTIGNIASIANKSIASKSFVEDTLANSGVTPAVSSRSDQNDFSIRMVSARPSTDTLDPRSSISQYINSHQQLLSTIASGDNLALEGIVNAGKFRPSHSNSFSFSSQRSIGASLDVSLSNTPTSRAPIYTLPCDIADLTTSTAPSLLNQSIYLTPSGSTAGVEVDLASRGSLESGGKSSLEVPPRTLLGNKWSLVAGINQTIPEEDEATPSVSPDIPQCLVDHSIDGVDSSMGFAIPRNIEVESELTITPKRRPQISPVKLTGTIAPTTTPTKHLATNGKGLQILNPMLELEPSGDIPFLTGNKPRTLKRSVSSDGRWISNGTPTTATPKSILMNPLIGMKEPPISAPPMATTFSLLPIPSVEVIEGQTETSEAHHSFIESLNHSFSVDSPRLDLPKDPSFKTPKLLRSQSAISFQSPVKSPRRELERIAAKPENRGRSTSGGSSIRSRSRSPPASRSTSPKVGMKVKTIIKSIGRLFGGKRKRGTSASLFSSTSAKTSNISQNGDTDELLGRSIGDESYINIQNGEHSYLGLEQSHADWIFTETKTRSNNSNSTTILPPSLTSSHHHNEHTAQLHHDYSLWSLLGRSGPTVSPMVDTSPKQDSLLLRSETSVVELKEDDATMDDMPPTSDSNNSLILSANAHRFSHGYVDQRQSPAQNKKPRNSLSFISPSKSSHSSTKVSRPSLSPPSEVAPSPNPSIPSPSLPNAPIQFSIKQSGEGHTLNLGEIGGDGAFLSPEFKENAVTERE